MPFKRTLVVALICSARITHVAMTHEQNMLFTFHELLDVPRVIEHDLNGTKWRTNNHLRGVLFNFNWLMISHFESHFVSKSKIPANLCRSFQIFHQNSAEWLHHELWRQSVSHTMKTLMTIGWWPVVLKVISYPKQRYHQIIVGHFESFNRILQKDDITNYYVSLPRTPRKVS